MGIARPTTQITLSGEDEKVLNKRIGSSLTAQRDVLRARIVLECARGWSNKAIAKSLNTSEQTVCLWRKRFAQMGLAGLNEAPGRGSKVKIAPERIRKVIDQAVKPPSGQARWSCRTMAKAAQVSAATVSRLWRKSGIKPHRSRTFKLSNDPLFEEKFWDVVGLYLSPPANALVLSCDEKSQIQALERTQPGLPLGIGHIATKTHDYYRHGTVTLFAALDYVSGKIVAQTAPRHRHQEWLAFLKKIDQDTPPELDLHLICDNYATHKHARVRAWLARHPRFHIHFTPTSASWLNLVERFFRDVTQNAILPGSFKNLPSLVTSLWRFIDEHNLDPKRYVWHADPNQVIEKINRAWEALLTLTFQEKELKEQQLPVTQSNNETLH
jgi:transposase